MNAVAAFGNRRFYGGGPALAVANPNTSSAIRKISSRPRPVVNDPNLLFGQWYSAVVGRLNLLTGLEQGWDGYSAKAIQFSTADFALEVLKVLSADDTPLPDIIPGSGGELQLEWHTEDRDIELRIFSPFDAVAWLHYPSKPDDDKEVALTSDFAEVGTWLSDIVEQKRAAVESAA